MTARIIRTSPESPAHTRIDTHQIEPHLAKSGQIWTDSDTITTNSVATPPFPSDLARISPLPCRFRGRRGNIRLIDAVRYHRS